MDDEEQHIEAEDVEIIYSDGEDGSSNDDEGIEEFDSGGIDEGEFQAEVVDLAKYTFIKHSRSVFNSDVSKDFKFAVTGSEDDMAYVWSLETGEVIMECTGHKDSVTEVMFNHNDHYVATGDMGGLVQVWSISEKKLVWCYEVDDLEWMLWHHLSNVLLCGLQSGDIYIWQVPQGNCKVLPSCGFPCTCGKLLPDGKHLLTGYGDGKIRLWDIKPASIKWQTTSSSDNGVTSIDISNDGILLVVAPTGQILKITEGRIVGNILLDKEKDVEAVAFNNNLGVVATGSLSGQLCVWDIGKYTLRYEARIDASITVMKWSVNDKLVVGAENGDVYICDGKLGTLVQTLTGHTAAILSICISSDASTILTTSDDGTAKVFNTNI